MTAPTTIPNALMELDADSDNDNDDDSSNQLLDASYPEVLEKYKAAGIIANKALHTVLSSCKPSVRIVELCTLGDKIIIDELLKVYTNLKGKGQKGICFPTCISVNEIAGHNSPFSDDKRTLHYGDMVKIDLGVHIDGFCAVVAHTIVLGKCDGKKADAIAAAWSAAQSALRLLKPKNKNSQVTLAISKSATTFQTEPMDSVLSHEMRQYVIDHDNTIISKETPDRKVAEFEFEAHQVFGIDIMMSSGRGKAVDRGERCTIYKRNVEVEYPLKMKTSRELLKMINKKHPTFPFTMRNFEANRSRLGITECVRTNIVQPYPVLSEKSGEFVAQFKFTVIINPSSTVQITGLPLDMSTIHPSQQIKDNELNNLLSVPFGGILPTFYDKPLLCQYDPSLMNNTAADQKMNNNDPSSNNNKNRGNQNQNQNQNKNKNKNKHKNKNKNKNKKGNQQNKYRNKNKNKNKKNQNKNKNKNQKRGNNQNRNKNKNNNNNNNNKNKNSNNNNNNNNNSNNNQNQNQAQPAATTQKPAIMDLD